MPFARYSPPIERIKQDYARQVAWKVMRARRERHEGPRPPGPKIPDNSTPWIAEPKTVDDLCEIARLVQARVDEFWGWQQRSNSS